MAVLAGAMCAVKGVCGQGPQVRCPLRRWSAGVLLEREGLSVRLRTGRELALSRGSNGSRDLRSGVGSLLRLQMEALGVLLVEHQRLVALAALAVVVLWLYWIFHDMW